MKPAAACAWMRPARARKNCWNSFGVPPSATKPLSMLLALDTATRFISIALHDGQAVAAEATWLAGAYHTVELAPQVALLLRRAGVEPGQLRGVAVAIGPGSYTGLRIGLGFAKGLSLANALRLVGVPTLDILMRAQPPRAERALALLQAGRGRARHRLAQPGPRIERRGGAGVCGGRD